MNFELQPVTEAGRRFVALAQEHAADFVTRAERHDRESSFPVENFEALGRSGALAACVPEELGGLGLESLHDLMVGMSRLGRGDGSTAIAAHMHIVAGWLFSRAWRNARAVGGEQEPAMEAFLTWLATPGMVLAVGGTEPGTHVGFPLAEAGPVEGGWRISGRKTFATNAPVASLFAVLVRIPGEGAGPDRVGFAFLGRDNPGLEVRETWDALGMRASGSHDLVLHDAFVPGAMMFEVGPWGVVDGFWITFFVAGNLGLLGVFLGIAEAARDLVVQAMRTRRKAPSGRLLAERYAVQHGVARIEIDLAASRAVLARTSLAADGYFGTHQVETSDPAELHQLMKEYSCAKQVVNERAIAVVDRAMELSGGAGYLASDPLSRLYRDVRAGPFMQAYSPNEAFEYIGKVALGLDPALDL